MGKWKGAENCSESNCEEKINMVQRQMVNWKHRLTRLGTLEMCELRTGITVCGQCYRPCFPGGEAEVEDFPLFFPFLSTSSLPYYAFSFSFYNTTNRNPWVKCNKLVEFTFLTQAIYTHLSLL